MIGTTVQSLSILLFHCLRMKLYIYKWTSLFPIKPDNLDNISLSYHFWPLYNLGLITKELLPHCFTCYVLFFNYFETTQLWHPTKFCPSFQMMKLLHRKMKDIKTTCRMGGNWKEETKPLESIFSTHSSKY